MVFSFVYCCYYYGGGAAIANVCPRTCLKIDYLGIIVGILSLLTAALIGWQVFNAIEMRNVIKSVGVIKRRLNQQGRYHEDKAKSLEWLISALHGETYKRENFNGDTAYFLHCLDVIGCFIKSGVKSDNPPFNRCMEELEVIIRHIKETNDASEILCLGGNKDFVRKWYHKAIQIIDTEANNLDNIKSRLTIIYEDYITLTKDVKIHPQKWNKTQKRP